MISRACAHLARALWVTLIVVAWMAPASVSASAYSVTAESDWYFTIDEDQTQVIIYGNSNRECDQPGADPYLWLYDDSPESTGVLIAQDDDGNTGVGQCVSSKIHITLDAGDYRLRAGYYPQQRGLGYEGGEYELVYDSTLISDSAPEPATTTSTSTTSTSTTSTSTTTTTSTSTSTSTSTTTVPPTTTTTPVTTSTTSGATSTLPLVQTSTTLPATTTSTTVLDQPTIPVQTTSTTEPPPPATTVVTSTTTLPPTSSTPVVSTALSTAVATTVSSTSTTSTTTTTLPATTTSSSSIPSSTTTAAPTTSQPATTVPMTTASQSGIATVDELIASPDDITPDDIITIAETVDLDALPPAVVGEIIAAVQASSDEVRQTFESEINIFGGLSDGYVPLGSNVSVGQRRTIVVVTVALASPAVATNPRKRPR